MRYRHLHLHLTEPLRDALLTLALVSTFVLATTYASGTPTPVQVGDIMAGTCDSTITDTELGATEVLGPAGDLINEFPAYPGMNVCVIGMATDASGYTFVQTDQAGMFEFDQFGNRVNPGWTPTRPPGPVPDSPGSLPRLRTVLHDQRGNYYMADSQAYIDRAGGPDGDAGYAVPGGTWQFDLLPDQHTVVYVSVADSNVRTYDISTGTSAQLLPGGIYTSVVALPDSTVLVLTRAGLVYHYDLTGHLLKSYTTIPYLVDGIAADPDGTSFRSIYTYYDDGMQQGYGTVYKTSVATGDLLASANVSPGVSNGRYYSGSLQVYGSGLAVPAQLTKSLKFGNAKVPVPVGSAKIKSIAVKNLGTTALIVSGVSVRSDDGLSEYTITRSTCGKGVTPGTHCNVWIAFLPTSAGTYTGSVTVNANTMPYQRSVPIVGVAK